MAEKRINLALQGGGAHGAFTWGALDRILEDDRIEIAGLSGTSAGALNAAAVKSGLLEGGRDGARAKLDWLWGEVAGSSSAGLEGWFVGGSAGFVSHAIEASPFFAGLDTASRLFSPYALGPFYSHPLRNIVERLNFDTVCAVDGPKLFVCATNVRSGKIRIFSEHEISTDAILASGCLPTIFQAIEIDDPKTGTREAYWDGGYMGNPALFPLFDRELPDDIVIVNINPLYREKVPKTPQEIQNRINEISFNGSLLRELRAINFATRLLHQDKISEGAMKDVLVHMVANDELMNQLSVATKLIPNQTVVAELKAAGRASADEFLDNHFEDLNERSSVNLESMFT